jgi:hypothetical protein
VSTKGNLNLGSATTKRCDVRTKELRLKSNTEASSAITKRVFWRANKHGIREADKEEHRKNDGRIEVYQKPNAYTRELINYLGIIYSEAPQYQAH